MLNGRDPANAVIALAPRAGETHLRTQDILEVIEKQGIDFFILFYLFFYFIFYFFI